MQPVRPLDELIAKFMASQRARNHSPNTIEHYRNTFKDFDRFLMDSEKTGEEDVLTTPTMRAFGVWLRETPTRGWRKTNQRAVQGTHGRLRDMKAFTRWLESEELIDRAPRVELPRLPQEEFPIMSDQDLATLFGCRMLTAPGDQAVRNRAIIGLMLDTGLRRSEVAGVELADLDLEDQLILVTGKGSKQRRVPFSSGVSDLLRKWLTVRGIEEGALFWLTSEGIYQIFRRIHEETGLKIHPHLLRHQAASMMVRNNADIYSVKKVLGHSSITVTERYVTQNYEDLRARHAVTSPFEAIRESFPTTGTRPRKRRLTLN